MYKGLKNWFILQKKSSIAMINNAIKPLWVKKKRNTKGEGVGITPYVLKTSPNSII